MVKQLWFLILGMGLVAALGAQVVPLDPGVRTGTLDNGVRYFLLSNPKPENRVELRLTVQAGSLQETDSEKGLAHLVEHLQFEGTERFGPQEIIQFLESNGMKFGGDLNATTNFTETQYFLDLPADRPDVLAKGLTILEDWAHGPRVSPEGLEKEKRIIAEEERVRMESVQGRLTLFTIPVLYQGTPYADRLPIGDRKVLAAITPADVDHFVKKWYTPRALSVQIVGSIDPVAVEAQLKKAFTKTWSTASAPPVAPPLPPYTTGTIHAFQDPDLGANVLIWNKVVPYDPQDVLGTRKQELTSFVIRLTLAKRFAELTQAADPPFLQAGTNLSPYAAQSMLAQFQLVVRDGAVPRSLDAYLTELRRIAAKGVTATDFQLALGEYRSQVEAGYAQRANVVNRRRAAALGAYALTGAPVLSDEDDYRLRKLVADQMTVDEVNRAGSWLDLSATKLLVLTTGKPGVGMPDEATLKTLVAQATAAPVQQSQERVVKPLFTTLPTPGKITKTETVPGTPLTRWTLSNGLVVYTYLNAFTKNEVQLRALSPGGVNRLPEAEFLSSALAPTLFSTTGLGSLTQSEFNDFLSGHQVRVGASVEDTDASVSGTAVPADLELLFQWVHRKFQAPRRDPGAETSFLQRVEESLKNQQSLPQKVYQDEVNRILGGGSFRSRPFTAERMVEVQPDVAARAYQKLFEGAAGFTVTITGDTTEEVLRPLVERYLASLPGGPTVAPVDPGSRPLVGPLTSVVKKGQDDKAVVTLLLPVARPFATADRWTAAVLEQVVDIRLREVVRQDKEGTYNVNVDIGLSPFPYPSALTRVNFTCDRARQDELRAAVITELEALAAGRISDEVLAKAVEICRKALETDQKVNGWWASTISAGLLRGEDPAAMIPKPGVYDLKKPEVVALAQALLTPGQALTVLLNPETP